MRYKCISYMNLNRLSIRILGVTFGEDRLILVRFRDPPEYIENFLSANKKKVVVGPSCPVVLFPDICFSDLCLYRECYTEIPPLSSCQLKQLFHCFMSSAQR